MNHVSPLPAASVLLQQSALALARVQVWVPAQVPAAEEEKVLLLCSWGVKFDFSMAECHEPACALAVNALAYLLRDRFGQLGRCE